MNNEINYNPDVLTCLANLSNDEVFTPPDLVNQMLDSLPSELWCNPNSTFLDPMTKTGIFLREIAKRLNIGLAEKIPDLQARLNHIYSKQLYGIAITNLTALLSRRSLYCAKKANGKYSVCTVFPDEQGNIRYQRTEHCWQSGKCSDCGANQEQYDRALHLENHAYAFIHGDNPLALLNIEKNMRFDVIIGNPPYQLSDGGDHQENARTRGGAIPIYHKFVEQAIKLNPRYLVMITPSRWFTGGRGLDEFRSNMLSNIKGLKEIHDFPNSSECFPSVDIKGGVNYFLWDSDYQGDCLINLYENRQCISSLKRPLLEKNTDVFIRYNNAISILHKIKELNGLSFNEIIRPAKPFGFRTNFTNFKKEYFEDSIKIYANRAIGYINLNKITQNREWVNKHKIFVPYAIGSGDSKTDLVKPIYAEPNTCCTETYLVFGPFNSKEECENVISYIQTKFFHFMLTLKKHTQHATRKAYEFVPIQNFNESWSDEKLYAKYGLTEKEIAFIESMVRPMEIDNV